MSRAEALRAQFSQEALQHCSGPGFELFDPLAQEVYERHLRILLTDSEQEFLECFTKERSPAVQPLTRRTVLVRKDLTLLTDALAGSSEMLIRKEAEILVLGRAGYCRVRISHLIAVVRRALSLRFMNFCAHEFVRQNL